MSTNNVYGDAPNERLFRELLTRYHYADAAGRDGIDETCRARQHSQLRCGARVRILRARSAPRRSLYLGGGRANSVSMFEAIAMVEEDDELQVVLGWFRAGTEGRPHLLNLKFAQANSNYPAWNVSRDFWTILETMIIFEREHLRSAGSG